MTIPVSAANTLSQCLSQICLCFYLSLCLSLSVSLSVCLSLSLSFSVSLSLSLSVCLSFSLSSRQTLTRPLILGFSRPLPPLTPPLPPSCSPHDLQGVACSDTPLSLVGLAAVKVFFFFFLKKIFWAFSSPDTHTALGFRA